MRDRLAAKDAGIAELDRRLVLAWKTIGEREDQIATKDAEIATLKEELAAILAPQKKIMGKKNKNDKNDWIEWKPTVYQSLPDLADDTIVFVRFRDGMESRARRVDSLRWGDNGQVDDVIAYKVIT